MKQVNFLRWLIENGVKTEEGTRHTKLYYNGEAINFTETPRERIGTGLVCRIKKQLGI